MNNNFSAYITNYKKILREVFKNRFNDEFSVDRMLTKEELDKIMREVPLSVAIPSEYGGRGAKVKECLAVLSAASYESLRSEEHTSELQSRGHLVCRLLLEKKNSSSLS